jgi:hypothetical protein
MVPDVLIRPTDGWEKRPAGRCEREVLALAGVCGRTMADVSCTRRSATAITDRTQIGASMIVAGLDDTA